MSTELVALGEEVRNMLMECRHSCGFRLSRSGKKVTVSKI